MWRQEWRARKNEKIWDDGLQTSGHAQVTPFHSTMGGPNLEVFKFSLYLFVPIAALVHFGDPEWYRRHVVPVGPRPALLDRFYMP